MTTLLFSDVDVNEWVAVNREHHLYILSNAQALALNFDEAD